MGYIRANDTGYWVSTGVSFTLSLWFKADNSIPKQTLFFYGTTPNVNAFAAMLENATLTIYTPTARVSFGDPVLKTGVDSGFWYHMVYTHDGATGTHRLYVDGILRDTQSGAVTISLNGTLWMGWNGADQLTGNLRDVMTFTDLASAQDVAYLYQDGCATYTTQALLGALANPLDWWPLDECSGTQVANNFRDNPGTVEGMHSWEGDCPCFPTT